eukprot:TRINITY_DN5415_c0_g1_i1.p1 TRINITY_DN5415_c0_g1~~TRINITY_DN5415_c0_g1_i1.p1  ORF type:complete len:269 (+),score=53.53 TRINITY_DN5415_c0_g1_i1:65-808(+)
MSGLLLFVRLYGEQLPVEVDPGACVEDVVKAVEQIKGVRVTLSLAGETLSDPRALIADIGVCSESTLDARRGSPLSGSTFDCRSREMVCAKEDEGLKLYTTGPDGGYGSFSGVAICQAGTDVDFAFSVKILGLRGNTDDFSLGVASSTVDRVGTSPRVVAWMPQRELDETSQKPKEQRLPVGATIYVMYSASQAEVTFEFTLTDDSPRTVAKVASTESLKFDDEHSKLLYPVLSLTYPNVLLLINWL